MPAITQMPRRTGSRIVMATLIPYAIAVTAVFLVFASGVRSASAQTIGVHVAIIVALTIVAVLIGRSSWK